MGLGKTVEIIGLMLMNPRRTGIKRKSEDEIEVTPDKDEGKVSKLKLRCICHKPTQKLNSITCKKCWTSQHIKCVFQTSISEEDRNKYKCPFCWKKSKDIIDSPTTLIIMPASIKTQWKDEIQRHVKDNSFKLLIYNGISNGWISPHELVKYDAILTDFNTLSSELYFSDPAVQSRQLRHPKKFEFPPSPLTAVRFWRVVFDEAQMIENKTTRPSQMVKQLLAINRWGTTGTPIEKGSILCLYGLVFFLNLSPFTDEKLFNQLFNQPDKMIKVLSKVMWRTCKKDVEHEINIPKQTEIVHEIKMTNLQECFYRQAHLSTKPHFMKSMQDYLLRNGPLKFVTQPGGSKAVRVRTIDLRMKDKYLHELNNATLKIFLEPLRCLRQDCTIPSIVSKSFDQAKTKITLKPEQLHDHLVSKASLETKSALRTICSSINGIAALKIAEHKFEEALTLYKHVLKLASENTGVVCVDSMLQIHVYQGLIDISSKIDNEEEMKNKEHYETEMGKLEWKYIKSYYEKVEELNVKLDQHLPELRKTAREQTDTDGKWWRGIICFQQTREEEQRLMDIINAEVFSSMVENMQILEQVRSINGIQLIITEWCDKIQKYTFDVKKRYNNLKFIAQKLRPKNEMSREDRIKVEELTKAALSCHLNLLEEIEDRENSIRRVRGFCELCKLKAKLNEYECVLFNKIIVDDNAEGTRNPRFEEKLMKAILDYAKRSDFDSEIIEMGGKFFKYLEALKTQFKLHSLLWVEVNYTISAFDELNMCKIRMQVVDSLEVISEEDTRFRLKIPRHEVEDQIRVFTAQRQEADLNFIRLNGRLKYLEHLKEENDTPTCPICQNIPTDQYFVTICGHTFCSQCYLELVKHRNRHINCPVCRTTQQTDNIYSVMCVEKGNQPIHVSFSPKIDEITRTILRLKIEEPKVKILIFSHWDNILQTIITALQANKINCRASCSSNFSKQIQDFKDYSQDITCILLNLKFGGKGLNLIEATHVFLVEPILNADEELQAIGRVHRIGQTRETFVHRFIAKNTIEETIYNKIIREREKWMRKQFTIKDLEELFDVDNERMEEDNEM